MEILTYTYSRRLYWTRLFPRSVVVFALINLSASLRLGRLALGTLTTTVVLMLLLYGMFGLYRTVVSPEGVRTGIQPLDRMTAWSEVVSVQEVQKGSSRTTCLMLRSGKRRGLHCVNTSGSLPLDSYEDRRDEVLAYYEELRRRAEARRAVSGAPETVTSAPS